MFWKARPTLAGIRLFAVLFLSLGFGVLISQSGCGGSGGGSGKKAAVPGSTNTGTGTGTGTSSGPNGTGPTGTGTNSGVYVNPREAESPFCFKWTTPVDADQAWLEMTADKIRECNVGLYKATEGQAQLGTQYLSDKSPKSNITIENLDSWLISYGAAGLCSKWVEPGVPYKTYRITLCGKFKPDIFLHEFCHGQFEKSGEEYKCKICIMSPYDVDRKTQLLHYCDSADCQVGGEWGDCWGQFILKKYTSWTHTGKDPGSPGDCIVEVTDK